MKLMGGKKKLPVNHARDMSGKVLGRGKGKKEKSNGRTGLHLHFYLSAPSYQGPRGGKGRGGGEI